MKAIMYHYVREFVPGLPNFRYLHVQDFVQQLDHFSSTYRLLNLEEFTRIIQGDMPVADDGVVLTFDDGFKDHYEFVYPELKRRGLFGIFYIPTRPLVQGSFLDVHRIHLILGKADPKKLMVDLSGIITDQMIPDSKITEFREQTYTQQKNDDSVTLFKRTLNYFIDYKYRAKVIDELYSLNALKFEAEDFYLSPAMIRKMANDGMLIGSHSHTHPVFSKLHRDEQEVEIQKSFAELELITGRMELKTFCYPYGGFHSFNQQTEDILTQENVAFSFNVEPRDITKEDLRSRPQALPRYDCNQFPHGTAR